MDVNIKLGDYILNCRSVGIIIGNNKILFQKKINDKYWALPGGKIKIGETGEDAIRREMNEELGISLCNVKIHSVSENFFEINGVKYHWYIFSYILDVNKNNYIFNNEEFNGLEKNDLIYKWFDIYKLDKSLIKPDYLYELLSGMEVDTVKFVSTSEL